MHSQFTRIFTIIVLTLLLVSNLSFAQDTDAPEWTETKEQWGQLLFCQRIYMLPVVKPRLYSFDIEQCGEAQQLVENKVSQFSGQAQTLLRKEAVQHAYGLSYNTSEPYHSVPACREFCKEVVEAMEKGDE